MNLIFKETPFEKYFRQGVSLYEHGKYTAAAQKYTNALEQLDEVDELFYNRGLCYYALKKYELAVNDYSRAIELSTDDTDFIFARAMAHTALQNFKSALEDIGLLLRIDNVHVQGRYLDMEKFTLALDDFLKVSEYNEYRRETTPNICLSRKKIR